MNNFNIRYKLIISFLILLLIILPVTFYNIYSLNSSQKDLTQIVNSSFPRIEALFQMQVSSLNMSILINDFNNTKNISSAEIDSEKNALLAYLGEIDQNQKNYQEHISNQQQSALDAKTLGKLKDAVMLSALDVFTAKQKNVNSLVLNLKMAQLNQAQINLNRFLRNSVHNEFLLLNDSQKKAIQVNHTLFEFSVIASVIFIILTIVLSFFLAHLISKPIIQLKDFALSINKNTINKRIPILSKDEIGDLAKSLNNMLEKLSKSETQLIEASREAGKAEIAINILHNVGNILTSINVSIAVIKEIFNKQQAAAFSKAIELLKINIDNLNDYLKNDEKGKIVLPYLTKSAQYIESEQKIMQTELDSILENMEQVNNIIAMQNSFTKVSDVFEPISANELVDNILLLNASNINKSGIQVKREYDNKLEIVSAKSKLEQILAVLIKNSVDALEENQTEDKKLTIKTEKNSDDSIRIVVHDNGIGISKENMPKIFSFGFSTKEDSHGYALHNAFLLAKELGGIIQVQSEGVGTGSSFILELPNLKANQLSS